MTKNKGGRPSEFKAKYDHATIISLMSEGAGKIEVCAALNICYDTLLAWSDPEHDTFHKEFLESIKKGELLSQAWWEKKGREKLEEPKFNSTLWFMNVKNRFRKSPVSWSDKTELEHSGEVKSITVTTNVVE